MKVHELMSICAEIVAKNPEAEVFIPDTEYYSTKITALTNELGYENDLVLDFLTIY